MAGRKRYPEELRLLVVGLVKDGHRPATLARELEPSEKTIRNWVKQADLDARLRSHELTTEVRRELARMKQENRRLRMERDILRRAASWFAAGNGSTATRPTGIRAVGSVDPPRKELDS